MEFLSNKSNNGKGGAIEAEKITVAENTQTTFSKNSAHGNGGAIWVTGAYDGMLTFNGGTHTFTKNESVARGGAIAIKTAIDVNSGSTLTFDRNKALIFGGAIYSYGERQNINLYAGSKVDFLNNLAYSGGAIHSISAVNLLGELTFSNNQAVYNTAHTDNVTGGAISTTGSVTLGKLQQTSFSENSVISTVTKDARGGAIYASSILFNGGNATFTGNTITAAGASTNLSGVGGGAIYSENAVTIASEATAKFIGNSITNAGTKAFGGGAIWAKSLSLAGTLEFIGNSVTNTNSAKSLAHGGAILSLGSISFDAKTNATFSGNSAAFGGAVRVIDGGLSFSGNGGKLTFSENIAGAQGGAIYAGNSGITSTISLGGEVVFSSNKAGISGGAIYLGGDSSLGFSGDTTNVVFSGNKIGNDTSGWTSNDISTFGAKNAITIADAGTYVFGGGIDSSSGSAVSISEANVTFQSGSVTKLGGATKVSDGANVTLGVGTTFDLQSGAKLTVGANSVLKIHTNLSEATVINVAKGASVSFDNAAKLIIDVSTTMLRSGENSIIGDIAKIAIIRATEEPGIGDFENIELLVNGEKFDGSWMTVREDYTLYLTMEIPEPSAFGMLIGLGTLALAVSRRRRRE